MSPSTGRLGAAPQLRHEPSFTSISAERKAGIDSHGDRNSRIGFSNAETERQDEERPADETERMARRSGHVDSYLLYWRAAALGGRDN
jgi:hypothetical protein